MYLCSQKAARTTNVDFVDLSRDSTIQASLMVLTAPSVRPLDLWSLATEGTLELIQASLLSLKRSFVTRYFT